MAANQSRRRVEAEGSVKLGSLDPSKPFLYQELKADVDCIRLLTIEPAQDQDAPIVCRLDAFEFGEKPKYEALSYMWGSENNQASIVVNGFSISVRQNLLGALRYLRSQARDLPIWIDALCINQEDVTERNRQLRIMHHIYFRASMVIVWLGESYSKFQHLLPPRQGQSAKVEPMMQDESICNISEADDDYEAAKKTKEVELVQTLSKDGYWQRLWIIQEVGQAENISICFCSFEPMQWHHFIHLMRMHNIGNDGPLRLERLRHNADEGALTFRRLLYDHQAAVCSEPRDKIYGLVGLAADAHGFPMDYTKPLIEVWKDVMIFTNERKLIDSSELMRFGAMVKSLLMGQDCSPLKQILRPPMAHTRHITPSDVQNHSTFHLKGAVLGQIVHVGPTTTEMISQVSTVDAWNQQVQENYRWDVEEAQRESKRLQRAILNSTVNRECYNHMGNIQWSTFVVGTAWVTEDVATSGVEQSQRMDCFTDYETIPISMDADTIFVMLAQQD
ncbi:hypothetical protein KJ359_004441 [Pestalotiopsis sp. 9143b]|nr:hypothetical protein KJ359_004441 [Pestalotiopsis sp. 9143b]